MRTSQRNHRLRRAALGLVGLLAAGACGSDVANDAMLRLEEQPVVQAAPVVAPPVEADRPAGAAEAVPSEGTEGAAARRSVPGASAGKAASAQQGAAATAAAPATGQTQQASGNPPGKAKPNAPAAPSAAPAQGTGTAVPIPAGAGPIKLGAITTTSGPIGASVLPISHGTKAWLADVNARGGAAGHPVQLIMGDDGGDPNKALALAKQMIEQDKVIALWFIVAPTSLQAVTPYVEQKGIPIMEVCSCNSATDSSPMVFQTGPNSLDGNAFSHVLGLTTFTDKRKVAVLYCREVSACQDLTDSIVKVKGRLGIDVVYKAQVTLAQPDYTAEVLAAKNAGADAIVTVTDLATTARVARSAHRQAFYPAMSTNFNAYEERLFPQGADVDGLTMGSLSLAWSESPKMADFRAAMKRYVPGGILSAQGANAWVAGKLLEKLAVRFGQNPTTNDVLEGLYSLRNETLDGLLPGIAYKRDQPHAGTNHCVVPVQFKAGKFTTAKGDQFVCDPAWKPVTP